MAGTSGTIDPIDAGGGLGRLGRREGEHGCKNADRLGPYGSEAEASRALDKVAERNEAWENDPDWNDDAGAKDGGTDGETPDSEQ